MQLKTYTDLYRRYLKPGYKILDLCSSCNSHIPTELQHKITVIGHGMNKTELEANKQLTSFFVQDLNQSPMLDNLETNDFNAVLCCCGIQYLAKPVDVLKQVNRILKPGGVVVISFSSDCFEEKAIAGWLSRDMDARQRLVQSYVTTAAFEMKNKSSSMVVQHTEDDFSAIVAFKAETQQAIPQNALGEIELLTTAINQAGGSMNVSAATLERWVDAYKQQCRDAHMLGIPLSALPQLPRNPSVVGIKNARDHLDKMIASFLSAGL